MKWLITVLCLSFMVYSNGDTAFAGREHNVSDRPFLTEVNIRYTCIDQENCDVEYEYDLSCGPYLGISYIESGNTIHLEAPDAFYFPGMLQDTCSFAFWTINENVELSNGYDKVEPSNGFEYTVPKEEKVIMTAWYDCSGDCIFPSRLPYEKDRTETIIEVCGIMFPEMIIICPNVVRKTEPSSLLDCKHNPCAIIMNRKGEELSSITAHSEFTARKDLGNNRCEDRKYFFKNWLFADSLYAKDEYTIEISLLNRAFYKRAYVFYDTLSKEVPCEKNK